ncbi:MAG: hypothetical protein M0R77_20265 [Gammaproteobacteria bacterium]|nr:hypothetical protein [Gammaproteobacteria bacterium]
MRRSIYALVITAGCLTAGCEQAEYPFGAPDGSSGGGLVDGVDFIQLTSSNGSSKHLPIISSDGNTVAFLSSEDLVPGSNTALVTQVFAVSSSGRNLRQVTSTSAEVTGFDLSPDGDWVVFADKYSRLWRVSTDEGSTATQIALPVMVTAPKFTPDGEFVIWTDASGANIYDFESGGISTQLASVIAKGRAGGSRNADDIVYTSRSDGKVYIVSGTSSPERLSQDSTSGTNPSISSDGRRIAYDGSAGVHVVGNNGNSLQTFTGYLDPYSGICESGDYVVFTAEHQVVLGEVSSGKLTQITSNTSGGYRSHEPSLSRYGSRVAFVSEADFTGGNSDHSYEVFVTR